MIFVKVIQTSKRIGKWVFDEVNLLGGPALVVLIGAVITIGGKTQEISRIGAIISAIGALWANYARNLSSKKLKEKNDEIVSLSKRTVSTITGGTSFAYIVPYGGIGPGASVCCHGEYPLYEVSVRITDLQLLEQIRNEEREGLPVNYVASDVANFSLGEMSPNTAKLLDSPFFLLHGDTRGWNIFFMARNGPTTQLLRMKLVSGQWEMATRVLRNNGRDVAYEDITENYPRNADGSMQWD